jgi:hypothetical protein
MMKHIVNAFGLYLCEKILVKVMSEQRIKSVVALGEFLKNKENKETLNAWTRRAFHANNWFTPENIDKSLRAIADFFCDETKLRTWLAAYQIDKITTPRKVGIVMAGNIPAVGFHDLLCVALSGHTALVKTSSQDFVLIQELIKKLQELNASFDIQIVENLKEAEAFIATGSDNTARHFEYYFRGKPSIIRHNRTSVAVISGKETEVDFVALGQDILNYYGLGCRNVSKIFLPKGYDLVPMLDALAPFEQVRDHHKYNNNYDYNKSIYLVNRVPHLDTGFLMFTENEALVSPISVVHYEFYEDLTQVSEKIKANQHKIQCVVGSIDSIENIVPFGKSQSPQLNDYADGIDTMAWLCDI